MVYHKGKYQGSFPDSDTWDAFLSFNVHQILFAIWICLSIIAQFALQTRRRFQAAYPLLYHE